MKKTHLKLQQLALLLAISITLFNCNDKLEENDGQVGTADLDYTVSEDMILPLVGAYSTTYTRGWEDPLLVGVRGDDVNAGGLGDQPLFAETDLFNYDNGFWMYNQVWKNFYGDIVDVLNAGEVIAQYKQFATGQYVDLADQYIAETKVLSGFQHLQMSKLWGDIFIITNSDPRADLENGVATKMQIMQYVSDLMDEAIPYLPDMRPNERQDIPGGVTKYTALAVKALANLEMENYQGVAEATEQIISSDKFSLHPDYYQLFKKPGKLSDENLFELQFSDIIQNLET